MTNLTPKQQRIYDFIRTFTRQMGYPPTVREIGQHVGVRSPSPGKYHLGHLRQAGLGRGQDPVHHPTKRVPPRPRSDPPGGPCGRRGPHLGGGVH